MSNESSTRRAATVSERDKQKCRYLGRGIGEAQVRPRYRMLHDPVKFCWGRVLGSAFSYDFQALPAHSRKVASRNNMEASKTQCDTGP